MVQWLVEFFYANEGLLVSPRPARIQAYFGVLTVFLQGGTPYQRQQNSWDGVPTMPYCWQTLRGSICASENGHGTIFSEESAEESSVPEVQDGVGGGVAGNPLPVPAREGATSSMDDTIGNTRTQDI